MSKLTGRPTTEIDTSEIDEILDLYISDKLYGNKSKATYNGAKTFNDKISNNPSYIRGNGELFKSYSRTIWSGAYQDKPYYGRQKIDELLSENTIQLIGEEFIPELSDINLLFDKKDISKQKLKIRVVKIFERERRKYNESQQDVNKYKQQRDEWQMKYEKLLQGVTNLMFQSQCTDNSLNDMFNLTRISDDMCANEFKEMFNNDLIAINNLRGDTLDDDTKIDNIIEFGPKPKEEFDGL